jgi:hypothetical protein
LKSSARSENRRKSSHAWTALRNLLRGRRSVPVRFDKRLDERIEQLEKHFAEPKERAEPGPPEGLLDEEFWEGVFAKATEDELERLEEIHAFIEQEIAAFDGGKPWRECAKAIEDFTLPERLEVDRRRWEENSLRDLGYVPGNNCEDCGKASDRSEPCQYCGGVVSWHGYLYKCVFSVDKLEREIAAVHRLVEAGFGGNTATLEGILERRLAEG